MGGKSPESASSEVSEEALQPEAIADDKDSLERKLEETQKLVDAKKSDLETKGDFSATAKEEFEELQSKYEQAKKSVTGETEDILHAFKAEVQGDIKEFEDDIKGIKNFENYKDIPGYDGFVKFMEVDGLQGGKTEERLFQLFASKSGNQIRKSILEFPNDVDGVKEMLGNIEKGVDVKKLKMKEKIADKLQKLEDIDISLLENEELSNMKKELIGYLKTYGKDAFVVHGLVDLNKVFRKREDYKKQREELLEQQEESLGQKGEELEKEAAEEEVSVDEKRDDLIESGKIEDIEMKEAQQSVLLTLKDVRLLSQRLGIHTSEFPEVGEAIQMLKKAQEGNDSKEMSHAIIEAKNKINAIPIHKIRAFFQSLEKDLKTDIEKKRGELQGKNIPLDSQQAQSELKQLTSYKQYTNAYKGFAHFSQGMEQKMLNVIPSADSILEGLSKPYSVAESGSGLETWQIENTMGIDMETADVSGDRVYDEGEGDIGTGVDRSDIPPRAFMMNNDTGFRLNIPFPKMPEDLQKGHEKLGEDQQKLYTQLKTITSALTLLVEKYNSKNFSSGETEDSIKQEIDTKQEEAKQIRIDLKANEMAFKKKLDDYNKQAKEEQETNKEKAEKILLMMSRIGLDRVPQHVITLVIETINIYPASYGFQKEINLDKGEFGFKTNVGESFWETGEFDSQDILKFTQLFAKAIGSPSDAILKAGDVNKNLTVVKDEGKFLHYLNSAGIMGIGGASIMLANLLKKDGEK